MKNAKPPDWLAEAVRAVREAVESNARTARLAALLVALVLAAAVITWGYQTITAQPETHVQVNVTITKR